MSAVADVRVEWLEAPGAPGAGSFRPVSGRGVRVSITLPDDGDVPLLTLSLKPKEARVCAHVRRQRTCCACAHASADAWLLCAQLSLPLRRCRVFGTSISQGRLTLRLEPEARPRGAGGAQVLLSAAEPEQLASLCRAIDAAFRGANAALPRAPPPVTHSQAQQQAERAPLAPLNGCGGKRPLGASPGKAVNAAAGKTPRDGGAGVAPRRSSAHEHASTSSAPEPPPPLSASQRRAVALVASRRNVFITGSAGTGKSFVLRRALEQSPCVRGTTFLTAPTGLAACALGGGGMTVNAFAGVGRGEGSAEELLLVRACAR
jgi:hypothetical protein